MDPNEKMASSKKRKQKIPEKMRMSSLAQWVGWSLHPQVPEFVPNSHLLRSLTLSAPQDVPYIRVPKIVDLLLFTALHRQLAPPALDHIGLFFFKG